MQLKLKNHIAKFGAYYLATFFLLSNAVFFAVSFESTEGYFRALAGCAQFFLFSYAVVALLPRIIGPLFAGGLLFAYYFLVCYAAIVGAPLDVLLVVRRWQEFVSLGRFYLGLVLMLVLVAAANAFILIRIKKVGARTVTVLILAVTASSWWIGNPLFDFIGKLAFGNKGVDFYEEQVYQPAVREASLLGKTKPAPSDKEAAVWGGRMNHIVMVQLESFNARLANPTTIPNFLNIAKQGIHFPGFYSNSVQTILAQENILCSLPSSFVDDLVSSGLDAQASCLPKLLKPLGYQSYFFTSSHLEFERTGVFMANIGFDQVHGYDTIQSGDPEYKWGRQEGVFLDRTFDYVEKNKQAGKSLLYLTLEATNHWPFESGSTGNAVGMEFRDRYAASMARQDKHLEGLIDRLDKLYPEKDYVLWIFGDHSWPAGIQSPNAFNQRGALDENFLTSLAIVAGDRQLVKKTVAESYSHMDTMPSIMELLGQPLPQARFRRSYASELATGALPVEKKAILLIQPYSDRYVVLLNEAGRYSLNLKQGTLSQVEVAGNAPENERAMANTFGASINLFSDLLR